MPTKKVSALAMARRQVVALENSIAIRDRQIVDYERALCATQQTASDLRIELRRLDEREASIMRDMKAVHERLGVCTKSNERLREIINHITRHI